jgi:hypothetical protein
VKLMIAGLWQDLRYVDEGGGFGAIFRDLLMTSRRTHRSFGILSVVRQIGAGDCAAQGVPDAQYPDMLLFLANVEDDSVRSPFLATHKMASGKRRYHSFAHNGAAGGVSVEAQNSLEQTGEPFFSVARGGFAGGSKAAYASVSAGAERLTR